MSIAPMPVSEMSERRFTPIYFRIQESIRRRITLGELVPGNRLPSETELAATFNTTRSTVRHALSLLVFEGLIVRKVGRGSFVAVPPVASRIDTHQCRSFEDQVALSGKTVDYRLLSFAAVRAPAEVAERLKIAEGADVYRLRRLRLIDGRPVCLEDRYILAELARQVSSAMLARRPVYEFLGEIIGERIPTIVVSVIAISAGKSHAEALGLRRGSALLVREHSYHDSTGRALLCGRSVFPGDIRIDYVLGREASPLPGD